VPPGIAAYVEVSGQIARQLTPGAKQFCGLFPEDCEAIARYIEETPYQPWGFPEVEIGTALVGWDGAGEELVQEGRRPLAGVSGEELWIGRYGFYCTYQYWIGPLYVSGPCLTFDGSFTYAVRPARL
jgi:hypothetical protein